MNLLFLTLVNICNIEEHGIYQDLMRVFRSNGHQVYIVSPSERKLHQKTRVLRHGGVTILEVKIGNIQKTSFLEKGISMLMIESQLTAAIAKYFADVKFDLLIYSTPPVTFAKVVSYVKRRDSAQSYLLLKDILPQGAVDLGAISEKNIACALLRKKEKKLYACSDYIGCMSQANVDFVLQHNPDIDPAIVHVSPNTIEVVDKPKNPERVAGLREKYGIPSNRTVFVYGGNLGKPQGIPFLIECLKANATQPDRFFVICGTGTEYPKLKAYVDAEQPANVLLINGLPKEEYEDLTSACDIGLIFLDHRFTVPNFPSRLLSYLQNKMPVLACTDPNTDVGKVITEGDFGWWCESDDVEKFTRTADAACHAALPALGETAYAYLEEHYTAEKSYEIIMEKLK